MKRSMIEPHIVKKDGVLKFSGTEADCYKYLHDAQPMSIHHACKYEGWSLERDYSAQGADDVEKMEDANMEGGR